MFETNKSKFNVESSFNEEMPEYTYVCRGLLTCSGEYTVGILRCVCSLSGPSWIAQTPRTSGCGSSEQRGLRGILSLWIRGLATLGRKKNCERLR